MTTTRAGRDTGLPSLSVVATNHNHARYLPTFFAGLAAQTHTEFEIIVVDDGSTDGSQRIINGTAAVDLRIVPIYLPRNVGVMAAVEEGMALAEGELQFWAACDDFLCNQTFFAQAAEAFRRHPSAGVVFGRAVLSRDDLVPISTMGMAPAAGFISPRAALQAFLGDALFIPGAAAILRRDAVEDVGGYPADLGPQSDYFVNHAVAARHGAVFLGTTVAQVRVGAANYSKRDGREGYLARHRVVGDRLSELDLPYPVDPKWLDAWRGNVERRVLPIL